ncbi:PREDICTED: uncharacterized protein LOC104701775 [Camelina sativa]|uniref:Uncharacterized protein LOC104701775 n=1 Tax=Camelina sativa TaxID=90675 RepID=A0ABM0STB0_CAMSA|nr:PREDICTED: uncharacterized protein LOC104701775 [Camelina sativa]
MGRTLFFRLHVGGYWAADGSYNGGETRCLSLDFEYPSLAMLTDMVSSTGYAENMNRIMPGRPKNNDRIKDPNEKTYSQNSQKAIVSCSNCGQTGHNKRTCQIEPVPKPPNPPSEFPSYHAKVIVKCSNCQQTGHNKRKCHLEPVSKPTCYFFCCIMFAFNVSLDFVVLF